jgi:hypothetical protein
MARADVQGVSATFHVKRRRTERQRAREPLCAVPGGLASEGMRSMAMCPCSRQRLARRPASARGCGGRDWSTARVFPPGALHELGLVRACGRAQDLWDPPGGCGRAEGRTAVAARTAETSRPKSTREWRVDRRPGHIPSQSGWAGARSRSPLWRENEYKVRTLVSDAAGCSGFPPEWRHTPQPAYV